MIYSLDTETRGLFGEIFRVGLFDGKKYQTFNSGNELMKNILSLDDKNSPINIFVFNLEFDGGKILRELISLSEEDRFYSIDYDKSLVINGNFHTIKIKKRDIYLRDIYPLVNCSLDVAAKSFGLQTQKMELKLKKGQTKNDWFKTVSPLNRKLNKYLKQDTIATYQLVQELLKLSKLDEEDFLKCPTVASLSMKIFKQHHNSDFQLIKETKLYKKQENFIRKFYYGGRTEVFKPEIVGGFHYDINSLYPSVMENFNFPIGRTAILNQESTQEERFNLLESIENNDRLFCKDQYYFTHCKVFVPFQNIGPLPKKQDGKLIFPTGVFSGYFTRTELEYARKNCGVKILEIFDILWFYESAPLFKSFISQQKEIKMTSEGAKRNFSKLIQNSLYGKFGMQRERINYQSWTESKYKKLEKQGKIPVKFLTTFGPCMQHVKTFFADYIRPQYSVIITSLARVELLKQMKEIERRGDEVYYCDTDSVVCSQELPPSFVDKKEYGKWKLERVIEKGIFILPKLYAEIDNIGNVILKSKGLISEYRRTLTYQDYVIFYQHLVSGIDINLYGETGKQYYSRSKILQNLKKKRDLDYRVLNKKQLRFSFVSLKRVFDFKENKSIPFVLNESKPFIEHFLDPTLLTSCANNKKMIV